MRLQSIQLFQFKNYAQYQLNIDAPVVAITGKNGIGKTNLLDAIYYLCFLRSYFQRTDAQVVLHGTKGFRIEGVMQGGEQTHRIACILREQGKKEYSLNGAPYARLSEHLGKFPCVMIAPDDIEIITGGSEERRRFLDTLICQINPDYLRQLSSYSKILQQRNAALKQMSIHQRVDSALLDILDAQLVPPGEAIFKIRTAFLANFTHQVETHYQFIAGEPYAIELQYESSLHQISLATALRKNRERDLLLQRTSAGVHKDDLQIKLGGNLFKQLASQGQRKSMLFALKLAEFEALESGTGVIPLLLLDDVFEKLDADRMRNLLQWLSTHTQGQVWLTDTHPERMESCLKQVQVSYQLVTLT